eukprot:9470339-Pyramimonas_sp.AAC.1
MFLIAGVHGQNLAIRPAVAPSRASAAYGCRSSTLRTSASRPCLGEQAALRRLPPASISVPAVISITVSVS